MSNLSNRANILLGEAKKCRVPTDYDEIINILQTEGYQLNESFICFQQRYAGLSYEVHNGKEDGKELTGISYSYKLRKHIFETEVFDGKVYFVCAFPSYSHIVCEYLMDYQGKVYALDYGDNINPYLVADSIEKFIEKDAVLNYLPQKKAIWLSKTIDDSKIAKCVGNNKFSLDTIEEASDSCTTWWKSKDESIFIELNKTTFDEARCNVYAMYKDVLEDLLGEEIKSAVGFPLYKVYDFDKRIIYESGKTMPMGNEIIRKIFRP